MKKITSLLIICLMLFCLCGCGSNKTIDLSKYITVTFEGYSGFGTAVATIDTDKLISDYGNDFEAKKEISDMAAEYVDRNYGDHVVGKNLLEACVENRELVVENNGHLSNGDTVKISFGDYKNEGLSVGTYNYDFKWDDYKSQAENLKEPEVINPLASYKFYEQEISPYDNHSSFGIFGITSDDELPMYISYEYCDFIFDIDFNNKTFDLSYIGLDEEQLVNDLGVVLEEKSHTYDIEEYMYLTIYDKNIYIIEQKMLPVISEQLNSVCSEHDIDIETLGAYYIDPFACNAQGGGPYLYVINKIQYYDNNEDFYEYYCVVPYVNLYYNPTIDDVFYTATSFRYRSAPAGWVDQMYVDDSGYRAYVMMQKITDSALDDIKSRILQYLTKSFYRYESEELIENSLRYIEMK